MLASRLLAVQRKPKGWSSSSYYRLRSFCRRISHDNELPIEVCHENLEDFLQSIKVKICPKVPGRFTRTHKTYLAELRRYFTYLNKEER